MPYVPALFTTLSLTTVGWSPRPLATMPSLPVQAMWFPVKVKRSQPGGVGDGGQLGGLKKLAMIPCAWIFALPAARSPMKLESTWMGESNALIPSLLAFRIVVPETVSLGAVLATGPLLMAMPVST